MNQEDLHTNGPEVAAFTDEVEEEILVEGTASDIFASISDNSGTSEIPQEPCIPQNATSLVWKFFKLTKRNDSQRCLCSLCRKEVSYSGTSNLWKHLATKHYEVHQQLRRKEEKPQSIKHFFPISDTSKQHNITNLIVSELICRDLHPFSIVEDSGFIAYNNFICPSYKMPSRKYISTTILDNQYEMVNLFNMYLLTFR